jgi:hypothetical protein
LTGAAEHWKPEEGEVLRRIEKGEEKIWSSEKGSTVDA